ncbi:MAG: efflux RND transporter periplasmic adaptor subunit, partial [Myxococcota bacterium]
GGQPAPRDDFSFAGDASMMRNPSLCLTALVALGALLFSGCAEETPAEIDVRPAVSTAMVTSVDLVEKIRASGELKALYHTHISAEIEGRITEIRIEEGTAVEVGAVVIEIDPERRKLDRNAAKARLAQARAELKKQESQTERMRKLSTQGISSDQQLEEAETALLLSLANTEAERAAFGVAERALSDASVSAPFAGFVARRSVQLGEFVQKGVPLFELVSLDPLEVEFSVSELDGNRVRNGLKVEVAVSAWPDRSFEGIVKFVSPTVDPGTRTLRIRAKIDNADGLLRPGLFARVNVGVNRREGITMVPEESLTQRAHDAIVFKILPDQRVKRVSVVPGARFAGRIEVTGNIHPGERVVRRGPGGLVDGAVVQILDDGSARAASALPAISGGKGGSGGAQ